MTQSQRPKTVALVDLSCLFKRTFEAHPPTGGQKTLDELLRIESRVERMVICLDSPPYSRKEVFPEYKAHRPEPDPSERYQKRWLYDRLKERAYQVAMHPGAEADDVIATLARIYGESCHEVWLVGADKDLAQCVTDNVLQLIPKHGERAEHFRGPKEVKEKYEVSPEQIPLYLALIGDKSDNIPGIPGIGQVKAAGLVGEFKTLVGIADNLARGTGKVWDSLREHWARLELGVRLTTLDSHLPIDGLALLEPKEPTIQTEMAPGFPVVLDGNMGGDGVEGFVGNETPMPEPEPAAIQEPRQPIIGKDPRADEFLRQEAEARARTRNADRAAQEQHDREEQREQEWREARRREIAAGIDARLAEMPPAAPPSAPRPVAPAAVTEAEFIPFGKPEAAPPKAPPAPAAPKPAELPDRPGLAKTAPEKIDYGIVTNKLEPEDLRSAEVIAKWLDAGGLYKAKFKTSAAIVTVIMYGKALGLPMMAALSGFHVIEGKPSASADLIRALAMRSPKCKYYRLVEATDESATWETWHRDHDEPTRLVYTIEEARKAGLRGGNWETRKKQMLVKTCSTILARWVYTIETMGLYCPEEMGDYVDTVGEAA